jgi:hypothetical protein
MIVFIWLAAATSALTFAVHTFIGGKKVAVPLLEDRTLPLASKWLNYYCWHVTTVLLAFYTSAFIWLAMVPHLPSLVFLSALSASLSMLSAAIAQRAGIAPWRFPSTSLFATIAVLSAIAALMV